MLIPFAKGNSRPGRLSASAWRVRRPGRRAAAAGAAASCSASAIARRWPTSRRSGLRGGGLFHDAQVPWAERLCVELARRRRARSAPGAHLHDGDGPGSSRTAGRRAPDTGTTGPGERSEIRCRVVVNAAGPWIDGILDGAGGQRRLNGGTKGSHVIVDPFPGAPDTCIFFEAAADQRPIFVFPWEGRYMLGSHRPDRTRATWTRVASDAEIDYLLAETNRLFPAADLTPDDVLYTVAGVRPLPYTAGVSDNAKISRGTRVHDTATAYQGCSRSSAASSPPTARSARTSPTRRCSCSGRPRGNGASPGPGRSPARTPPTGRVPRGVPAVGRAADAGPGQPAARHLRRTGPRGSRPDPGRARPRHDRRRGLRRRRRRTGPGLPVGRGGHLGGRAAAPYPDRSGPRHGRFNRPDLRKRCRSPPGLERRTGPGRGGRLPRRAASLPAPRARPSGGAPTNDRRS